MARYIDAELALELNEGELWIWDVPDLKNFLAEIPTANVVPKSECTECGKRTNKAIENLQAEIAQYQLDLHYSVCREDEAREKVAKEIFAEIEEVFRQHTEGGYYLNGTWFPERFDLYTGDAIAELKKKYIGGTS